MLKLEVRIDDEELENCCNSEDFIETIKNAAIEQAVYSMYNNEIDCVVEDQVKEVMKQYKDKIIEDIINRVSTEVAEKIARKKEILAVTPKISELNKINKDNEQYFMNLVDKAIAKRFK